MEDEIKMLAKDTSTAMSLVVKDVDSLIKEERRKYQECKDKNKKIGSYFLGRIAMLEDLKNGCTKTN